MSKYKLVILEEYIKRGTGIFAKRVNTHDDVLDIMVRFPHMIEIDLGKNREMLYYIKGSKATKKLRQFMLGDWIIKVSEDKLDSVVDEDFQMAYELRRCEG